MGPFSEFVSWAFYALLGGAALIAVDAIKSVHGSIDSVSNGVDELNKSITQMVERISWHEKEIERHHSRIERLEGERSKIKCFSEEG